MPTQSDAEIFDLAVAAGFTPDQAATMTAISLAEGASSSSGLWPLDPSEHPWVSEIDMSVPANQAYAAFRASGGGADISRWDTTHSEKGAAYLEYMDRAKATAAQKGFEVAGNLAPPLSVGDRQPASLIDPPGDWRETEPVIGPIENADDGSAAESIEAESVAPSEALDEPPHSEANAEVDTSPTEQATATIPHVDPANAAATTSEAHDDSAAPLGAASVLPPDTDLRMDTDQDLISTEFEMRFGTDPDVADTDGDGLTDGYEIFQLGTNALSSDSDLDGVRDDIEMLVGSDPTKAEGIDIRNAPDDAEWTDTDGDGIVDWFESHIGQNANAADTDGDGVVDSSDLATGGGTALPTVNE